MNTRESAKEAFLAACAAAFDKAIPSEQAENGGTFTQAERQGLATGRMLAAVLLEKWLALHGVGRGLDRDRCERCKGRLRIQEAAQVRCLSTTVGEVEYRRAYVVCDRCGLCYAPLDCAAGIPPTGGSVWRTHQLCDAAVLNRSFEGAAHALERHDGIEISGKQVRVIAETEGAELVDRRRAAVQAFQTGWRPPAPSQVGELLVVTADGGRLRTRQIPDESPPEGERSKRSSWREDKLGSVYDAVPIEDRRGISPETYQGAQARLPGRGQAQTKTYVASLAPWEEVGWMLCLEAWERGYAQTRTKLFLSDGAESLRTVRQTHFPDATFILDWYHAVERLSMCSKAAFGEGKPTAIAWYEEMKDHLWAGRTAVIQQALERESERIGRPDPGESSTSPRVILHRGVHYVSENKDGMAYPRFREQWWPLASGVAEGGVKQFGIRLKGSEKFWNHVNQGLGAEEMLALSALLLSEDGRWDRYWEARGRPYRREVRSLNPPVSPPTRPEGGPSG